MMTREPIWESSAYRGRIAGTAIAQAQHELGLTGRELGEMLGVGHTQFWRWSSGRPMKESILNFLLFQLACVREACGAK